MDDSSTVKAKYLQERIQKRNEANASILESYCVGAVSEQVSNESSGTGDKGINDAPKRCSECNGLGKVKGLFSAFDCAACDGVGLDMSEPITLIKWQQACMVWSKQQLLKHRAEIKSLRSQLNAIPIDVLNEYLKAKSMEGFYRDAKIKD
jgi:hypothetical protein